MENLQHHLEYIHEVEGVSFVHSMNHLILESMLEHVWISLSLQDFYMISRESESPHVLVKEASKTKSSKCFIHKKRRSKPRKRLWWSWGQENKKGGDIYTKYLVAQILKKAAAKLKMKEKPEVSRIPSIIKLHWWSPRWAFVILDLRPTKQEGTWSWLVQRVEPMVAVVMVAAPVAELE